MENPRNLRKASGISAQQTKEGQSFPLGATVSADGTNFSVYSKHATGIELLLFDCVDDARPTRVISIDPATNRTYHYWHVFVPGVRAGQIYGYRVHGAFDPPSGMRFDPAKVLLDPYGRGAVVPKNYSRDAARKKGDNAATAIKSVVTDPHAYDWEGDTPLNRPSSQTIVYEMHVRGSPATRVPGVAEKKRGTFAGLIEKIPYLKELGVTAVELMPVFQFDPQDAPPGRVNYWGYAPVSFFAPHQAYSSRQDRTRAIGRISRYGQGAAPGRYRGHSRRCVQPHCRRQSRRTDPEFSRLRQHHLLHSRTRSLVLRELQRYGKHTQRESSYCPPNDPGQPPLLGQRNACRRLPIRSGGDS